MLICYLLYRWRRQTLRRLEESESRRRILFEHSGAGLALLSADGSIVEANPALERCSVTAAAN